MKITKLITHDHIEWSKVSFQQCYTNARQEAQAGGPGIQTGGGVMAGCTAA